MEPQIKPPSPDELLPLELSPLDPPPPLLVLLPERVLLDATVPLEERAVAALLPDCPLEPPMPVELWRQPWQPPELSEIGAVDVACRQPAAAKSDRQQSASLTPSSIALPARGRQGVAHHATVEQRGSF